MSPSRPPIEAPADVPRHVSADELEGFLRGRWPEGTRGTLEIEGHTLPTVQLGEAEPPVLFVHGLGHDMTDFTPLFARRTLGCFTALDLPGFGCASLPPKGVRLLDLVAAVDVAARQCAQAAGGRAPLIVGSSLGGHVAQLAALGGTPCSHLFLLAPGGYQNHGALAVQTAHTLFNAERLMKRSDLELGAVNAAMYVSPAARRRAMTRRLMLHRSDRRAAYYRSTQTVVRDVFDHLIHERAARLPVPVTYVFGDTDVMVQRGPVERLAARIGAPLHVIPHCGHVPMVDAPDAVMGFLNPIIAQLETKASDATPRAHSTEVQHVDR